MPRRVTALVLLCSLGCGAPQPRRAAGSVEGFSAFPNRPSGSGRCGGFTVDWSNPEAPVPAGASPRLTVRGPDGRPVHQDTRPEPTEVVQPQWCGDLLGDGSPVLAYTIYTGGAHCCFRWRLVAPARRELIFDADLGNFGQTLDRAQLDGRGPYELTGTSDALAYFADLSFAASPGIPLAFAYDGRRYVEATRRFPDLLRDDLDRALRELRPGDLEAATALRALADSVLLGRYEQGLEDLRRRVTAKTRAWLDRHAAEAKALLDAKFK